MAKISAQTTRSALDFAPGQVVTASDLREVHRAQNAARIGFRQTLLNCSSRDNYVSVSGASNISANGEAWDPASTLNVPVSVYSGHIYIDPDFQFLFAYVDGWTSATTANVVNISVTIGSDTQTLLTPSAVATANAFYLDVLSFDTANTGTGWQAYLLTLERRIATSWGLVNFSLHGQPANSAPLLPDPEGLV